MPSTEAITERSRRASCWLRDLAGELGDVVVVTHGVVVTRFCSGLDRL